MSFAEFSTYLEPIIEQFTTGNFHAEVFAAKEEYFQRAGQIYEDDSEFDQRMNIFMDWYLYDRDLPGLDLPPVKYYFNKNKDRLNSDDFAIYKDLCNTLHSIFSVKRFSWNRKYIYIKDLFSNKVIKVEADRADMGFARGDIFEGRILPFKGAQIFSNGFCFHPVEMRGFILNEIKKVRHQNKVRQTKLILQLSAMKLDHLRFQYIDVKEVYSFNSKFRSGSR